MAGPAFATSRLHLDSEGVASFELKSNWDTRWPTGAVLVVRVVSAGKTIFTVDVPIETQAREAAAAEREKMAKSKEAREADYSFANVRQVTAGFIMIALSIAYAINNIESGSDYRLGLVLAACLCVAGYLVIRNRVHRRLRGVSVALQTPLVRLGERLEAEVTVSKEGLKAELRGVDREMQGLNYRRREVHSQAKPLKVGANNVTFRLPRREPTDSVAWYLVVTPKPKPDHLLPKWLIAEKRVRLKVQS